MDQLAKVVLKSQGIDIDALGIKLDMSKDMMTMPAVGANALEAVEFHPCSTKNDYINRSVKFNPTFAHHFFGEDQVVEGFKDVKIHVFFTVDTFKTFVKIEKASASSSSSLSDSDQTKIMEMMSTVPFPGGFCSTDDEFISALSSSSSFQPSGKIVCQDGPDMCTYMCTFPSKASTTNDEAFVSLHRRMEWFLHWLIDGVSAIATDDRWTLYLTYKTGSQYQLCAYATTYNFFSMPKNRLRISQFLVMPHMQGTGIGHKLLTTIMKAAIQDEECMEVTVEDPADAFMSLRDCVALQLAIEEGLVSTEQLYATKATGAVASSWGDIADIVKSADDDEIEVHRPKRLKKLAFLPEDSDDAENDSDKANGISPPPSSLRIPTAEEFKTQLKASPPLAARLAELVALASRLPHPNPSGPAPKSNKEEGRQLSKKSKREDDNAVGVDCLKAVRLATKQRLFRDQREEFEAMEKDDVKKGLEEDWQELYASYTRTIKRLRAAFPAPSPDAQMADKQPIANVAGAASDAVAC